MIRCLSYEGMNLENNIQFNPQCFPTTTLRNFTMTLKMIK